MSEERTLRQVYGHRSSPAARSSLSTVARASTELKRFLDLALREMSLALEYEFLRCRMAPPEDAEVDCRIPEAKTSRFFSSEMPSFCWLSNTLRIAGCGLSRVCTIVSDSIVADYRSTRLDELKLSARVAAQRVRETGQPFRFNPMSPRDRRIVHLELNGAQGVRTISEGVRRPSPSGDLSRREE